VGIVDEPVAGVGIDLDVVVHADLAGELVMRDSQPRTLSMSSNVRPAPDAISRMIVRRQR
ncbi:MAG TPA: hypothetical protein VF162_04740, partial [Streptosporangiaceae bacterium]